jgi:hypothetical protein
MIRLSGIDKLLFFWSKGLASKLNQPFRHLRASWSQTYSRTEQAPDRCDKDHPVFRFRATSRTILLCVISLAGYWWRSNNSNSACYGKTEQTFPQVGVGNLKSICVLLQVRASHSGVDSPISLIPILSISESFAQPISTSLGIYLQAHSRYIRHHRFAPLKMGSLTACSLGLSATSQQYFSLTTNQSPATSQQYSSLRTNQHQPSATSQPNRL